MSDQEEKKGPGPKAERLELIHRVTHGYVDPTTHKEIPKVAFPATVTMARDQFENWAKKELAAAGARSPAFWRTTKASLATALYVSAAEGLLPGLDGWFVPFGPEVVWMRNHKGVLKLVRRAKTVEEDIFVQCVMEGDEFEYWEDEEGPHWKFTNGEMLGRQRGPGIIGAFLRAFPRGSKRSIFVYLPWSEIDKRRKASMARNKGKETPAWKQWTPEMAMKTVILYAVARGMLPVNTEIQDRINRMMEEEGGAMDNAAEERFIKPERLSAQVEQAPEAEGAEVVEAEFVDDEEPVGEDVDEETEPEEEDYVAGFDLGEGDRKIVEKAKALGVDIWQASFDAGDDKEKFMKFIVQRGQEAKKAAEK